MNGFASAALAFVLGVFAAVGLAALFLGGAALTTFFGYPLETTPLIQTAAVFGLVVAAFAFLAGFFANKVNR